MALAYRSQAFTNPATTNPVVCAAPAGIVDGDILIATVFGRRTAFGGSVGPYTAPAGWTQIDTVSVVGGSSNGGTHTTWWKRAASESGSYSFNDTNTSAFTTQSSHIACYSGAFTTGSPIDVYSKANGTGTLSVASSITTTIANTYLIDSCSTWSNSGAGSWTAPGTMTPRLGGGGVNGGIGYFDLAQAASGATGNQTAINLNGAGEPWSAFLIALKPAPTIPVGAASGIGAAAAIGGAIFTAVGAAAGFGTASTVPIPPPVLLPPQLVLSALSSQADPNKIRRRTGGDSREVGEPWIDDGYTEVAGRLVAGETTGVIIACGQSNIGNYVNAVYTMTQPNAICSTS